MNFEKALADIRRGKAILVYDFDDREGETDLTVASQYVTYEMIQMMRKKAGGLICTTTPFDKARDVGLPYMADVYFDDSNRFPLLRAMAPNDIPYDNTKSSFGVTINHRKTYTGITDKDRALTISRYAEVLFQDKPASEIAGEIGEEFRSPGHVHLLNATEHILTKRRGHTELCTAMMYMAGVHPSATICEMMGDDGGSMTKKEAAKFAETNGIEFITGDQVLAKWENFKKNGGADY